MTCRGWVGWPRREWRKVGVSLAAMLVLTSCQGGSSRTVHVEGKGPLSASNGHGGYAMTEPAEFEDTWRGSFGASLLCSLRHDGHIELEQVTWDVAPNAAPRSVHAWLRVADSSIRPTSSSYGVLGLPWKPDHDPRYPGEYTDKIADFTIDQTCDDLGKEADQDTGNPRKFTELFVVIESDKNGAALNKTYIDYRFNGNPFRLIIDWTIIACGESIEKKFGQDWCPPDRLDNRRAGDR